MKSVATTVACCNIGKEMWMDAGNKTNGTGGIELIGDARRFLRDIYAIMNLFVLCVRVVHRSLR